MNKLIFKLDTNGKNVIEEELKYFIKNNEIITKNKNCIYKINLKENKFFKEDNDSLISIDINNKKIIIKLKENNMEFEMKIIKGIFENKENIINIEYTLDDGENTYNCIFIKY